MKWTFFWPFGCFFLIFIGLEIGIQSVGHMSKRIMQKKSIFLVKHFFHFLNLNLKLCKTRYACENHHCHMNYLNLDNQTFSFKFAPYMCSM
jgi:hypothetical protein